jgi:hypothetical protein
MACVTERKRHMQYEAPNRKNNSNLVEAIALRSTLRRLGVNAGELLVQGTVAGVQASSSIHEADFAEEGFDQYEPLNLSVVITGWAPEPIDALVAEIRRQFNMYGLYAGMQYLLTMWGCKSPDAHLTNLPGVGTAIKQALEKLANIDGRFVGLPTTSPERLIKGSGNPGGPVNY